MLTEVRDVTRSALERRLHLYPAMCKRVVDGSVLDLFIDLGFGTHKVERVRLYGIDASETQGSVEGRNVQGQLCKERLTQLVLGRPLFVETHRDLTEKHGHYLATIWVDGENEVLTSVNDTLVKESLAEARIY